MKIYLSDYGPTNGCGAVSATAPETVLDPSIAMALAPFPVFDHGDGASVSYGYGEGQTKNHVPTK